MTMESPVSIDISWALFVNIKFTYKNKWCNNNMQKKS